MEITNNAIEHSGAKKIHVQAQKSIGKIRITIQDDGIGIFKK
ncbi:MAG: histidine kinase, partial [Treponema sp.]|nr:histidine kinase [Treponema sp.]MBQ2465330.1 histidine kinase [Treponema sp.]MBQ5433455.1 histidine kinase [Treponema sp.]